MFFVGSRAGGRAGAGVCADPNNLPFSNEREEGFENRIAELVALRRGALRGPDRYCGSPDGYLTKLPLEDRVPAGA